VAGYGDTLFDRHGGYTASYKQTLVMSANAIETLSRHPRELAATA
jgi:hypothetical protein